MRLLLDTHSFLMQSTQRIVIIGLLCGCGTPTLAARGDWTTIYGSVREEARQVSSSSLASMETLAAYP